jgi:hypothetical protein
LQAPRAAGLVLARPETFTPGMTRTIFRQTPGTSDVRTRLHRRQGFRFVKRPQSEKVQVEAINALEAELSALSDAEIAARTVQFREQIAAGTKLDDLLVPAFATVREAARAPWAQAIRRSADRRHDPE